MLFPSFLARKAPVHSASPRLRCSCSGGSPLVPLFAGWGVSVSASPEAGRSASTPAAASPCLVSGAPQSLSSRGTASIQSDLQQSPVSECPRQPRVMAPGRGWIQRSQATTMGHTHYGRAAPSPLCGERSPRRSWPSRVSTPLCSSLRVPHTCYGPTSRVQAVATTPVPSPVSTCQGAF